MGSVRLHKEIEHMKYIQVSGVVIVVVVVAITATVY